VNNNKNQTVINLSKDLIENNKGSVSQFRALALAVCIKSAYVSSSFNDCTNQKLADKFGISRHSASDLVKYLIKNGLAFKRNNDLVIAKLYSSRHPSKSYKIGYIHGVDISNLKEMTCFLRTLPIINQIEKTKHVIAEQNDASSVSVIRIDYKTLAKCSGVSKSTVFEIVKWAVEKGLITKEEEHEIVATPEFGHSYLSSHKDSGVKLITARSGAVFVQHRNKYTSTVNDIIITPKTKDYSEAYVLRLIEKNGLVTPSTDDIFSDEEEGWTPELFYLKFNDNNCF